MLLFIMWCYTPWSGSLLVYLQNGTERGFYKPCTLTTKYCLCNGHLQHHTLSFFFLLASISMYAICEIPDMQRTCLA